MRLRFALMPLREVLTAIAGTDQSRRLRVVFAVIASPVTLFAAEPAPSFPREIRPLLTQYCFACHGPDERARKGHLRLDRREAAIGPLPSGNVAIVPSHPARSELIDRIESDDPSDVMPPAGAKERLSPAQKQLLRRWIETGAEYAGHWAYTRPVRPKVPETGEAWSRNEIDRFVVARQEGSGLSPAPEASRGTLIRRLSLDLTGLPPAIEEIDEFLADERPNAYERLVDRLLASPHYGERMAQEWLDLARFGDSSGYQDDGERPNWPYRDYAIAAFNAGMPFDEFTLENIAGDLLPEATLPQKIASGFHRLNRHNEEGGSDPDEFQVVYAVDRTNTVATTWMGLTFGCAQCHDHKYDPITQREYYQLYAFFNSLDGEVVISKDGRNSPPQVLVATPEEQSRLERFDREIAALQSQVKEKDSAEAKSLAALQADREKFEKGIPRAFVWKEMETPRPAHILARGDYRSRGEPVERNVPAAFPLLPADAPRNRLTLARWLVSPEHPLTARVVANRVWKQFFGTGLVRTPEDFGVRGEPPTHPELLDWLAVQLIEDGWSLKQFQRRIVLSATYRQSSALSPDARLLDPQNRLLARASRFRLTAEEIRDGALSAAGLLTRRLGGPSVYPYQANHFYRDKEDDAGEWKWPLEPGANLYRRGLYTFLRRTTPYPAFQAFDAPSRGECTVARSATNTPLQALVTLNDPTFVEAARVLAERILAEAGNDLEFRIQFAFRCVLARGASPVEVEVLRGLHDAEFARYRGDPQAAQAANAQGLAPRSVGNDPAELAAWTAVAAAMLNLDETITRE